MKCKKCKFFKLQSEPDKITFQCLNSIGAMNTNCLLKHLYWFINSNRILGQKVEKLIDKATEDIDEGEKWKQK